MPTNSPISNLAFNTWLSPDQANSSFEGLLLAQYLKGGYQTVITLQDRDSIPIYNEGATTQHSGFTNSGDDGKTTGRRSLGMMVHVVDPEGDGSVLPKTYILLPLGYFGNDGNLGWDTWSQLPEWEKAKRMKPSATVYSQTFPNNVEYTLPEPQIEDDCWVELIQFTEYPLPPNGFAGEVLAKVDDENYNVGWVSPQSGAQGDTGAQGATGSAGTDGNISSNDLGVVLDFQNNTGLILDGDVTVNAGDTFRVILSPDDTGPTSRLSGYFVANQSFIFTQQTSSMMAVNELLTDMEFFDSISLDGINGADGNQGPSGTDAIYATSFNGPHSLGDDRNAGASLGAVTVDAGLSYQGGEYIIISLNASPDNFDIAQVTSYDSSTGVMEWNNVSQSTVDSFSSDWNINLSSIPGLNASIESSWIGNMFTHPNFPGSEGISGLMMDGDVNVTTGDIFSINVYGDESAPTSLNGTFIATQDFVMNQATSGATAITEMLIHWNTDFEVFSQAILPIKTTSQEFTVTISANNKFEINGVEQDTLTLVRGLTYYFDTSSIDTNTHPFALSITDDGNHNGGVLYINGLEYSPAGSLSFIFNTSNLTPDTLYYYCAQHSGMGGTINIINPDQYSDTDVSTFLNGNLDNHIIPDTNASYDIGSAEYKIRHLYLSDNSLTMGDTLLNEQKILNTLNFNIDPNIPAPATQSEPGIKGDIRFDLNYMYICVEQDTWRRIALDSGWSL